MDSRHLIALVIAGLCIACSHSGQTNTNSTVTRSSSPESTKAAENKSALAGLIKNVSLYPVPGRSNDLAISLVVLVHNSGAPDHPDHWTLEVISPTAGIPTGLEPVHVNGVVELPGSDKSVDLAKEDLTVKGVNPIGRDSEVEGVLTFVLPGIEERALNHNSSSLVLHFRDSQGNNYQTPRTYIGKKVGG
jgi:hypothetical protein